MKKCYKCEKDKPLEDFSNNRSKPDGKNTQCKSCHSEYRKNNYNKNKDREKEINKKYYKSQYEDTNCTYCGEALRRHRTNVGENKNNFCDSSCMMKYNVRDRDYYKKYFRWSKRRAKIQKLEFNLDKNYLEDLFLNQGERCALTNIPLKLIYRDEKDTLSNSASVDRIDNSKGYIKGNVRWVCLGINYMKNRRDDTEVFELLNLIKDNYNKQ